MIIKNLRKDVCENDKIECIEAMIVRGQRRKELFTESLQTLLLS